MKLKSPIFFTLLLMLSVIVSANPVDATTARTVAARFFATKFHRTFETLTPTIAYTAPLSRGGNDVASSFYVVNFGTDGFVIVAGDDRMQPILAFSDEGPFITENMPEPSPDAAHSGFLR